MAVNLCSLAMRLKSASFTEVKLRLQVAGTVSTAVGDKTSTGSTAALEPVKAAVPAVSAPAPAAAVPSQEPAAVQADAHQIEEPPAPIFAAPPMLPDTQEAPQVRQMSSPQDSPFVGLCSSIVHGNCTVCLPGGNLHNWDLHCDSKLLLESLISHSHCLHLRLFLADARSVHAERRPAHRSRSQMPQSPAARPPAMAQSLPPARPHSSHRRCPCWCRLPAWLTACRRRITPAEALSSCRACMHSSQGATQRRMGFIRDRLAALAWLLRLKRRMGRHETTLCGGRACTIQGRRMGPYRRWALGSFTRALIGLFSSHAPQMMVP